MYKDLHTHTTFSDGELTPIELIELAKKKEIDSIAITDHNTVSGVKYLLESDYNLNDINFIPGIELSAKASRGQFHILGLGIDPYNKYLEKEMSKLKTNSLNYIISIIEQLKRDFNIVFTYDELINLFNSNHNLGRPDIAKLCLDNGLVATVEEAFTKYLNPVKDKVRGTNKRLTYEECIDLIIRSGGIPVLAHPQQLCLEEKEFLILLENMISVGLQGMEVYHSGMTQEEMDMYATVAHKYDLLTSGGSDYHGPIVKPNIELGDLKIKKLSILDRLRTY